VGHDPNVQRAIRSSRAWSPALARDNGARCQLLDGCALIGTLIADQDGICDRRLFQSSSVGPQGHDFRGRPAPDKGRLTAGIRHQAAQGELRIPLPPGYDYTPDDSTLPLGIDRVRRHTPAIV